MRTIADLEAGDHLCWLYETEEEHRAVLTPYLRQGLERGEKVVYIADARTVEPASGYLRDDGLYVEPFLARGQLVILSRDDAYLRDGVFDPAGMITLLRSETEQALAEGYAALRVTGEMTCALRGLPGSERLIEYEILLNAFFAGSRCLAICQYDCRRFEPAVLLDVLRTHPYVVIGPDVCENLRYVPTGDLPSADRPAAELQRWMQGLIERKRAEEALAQEQFLMQTLMNNIPDHIYFKDRGNRFIRVSKALAQAFGLSDPAQAVGKTDFDFFTEEHARQAYEDEQAIMRTGQPLTKEEKETWAERPDTWVSTTKMPWHDEEGNAVGTFGISRDVTERKLSEAERERLIGELRDALSNVRTLSGLLPICASCKKIRDDSGYWKQIESFIREHSQAEFSHGICPECMRKLYPDLIGDDAAPGG